jgi:hypothetical protein
VGIARASFFHADDVGDCSRVGVSIVCCSVLDSTDIGGGTAIDLSRLFFLSGSAFPFPLKVSVTLLPFLIPSFAFCAASCPNCRIAKAIDSCWVGAGGFEGSSIAFGACSAGFEGVSGSFGGSGAAGGLFSFVLA